MLDDDIKEKLLVLFVMVLIGLTFIIHIPEYIVIWKENENYIEQRKIR
jgi:cytochrome bd-type quinol oxidase subunit 1